MKETLSDATHSKKLLQQLEWECELQKSMPTIKSMYPHRSEYIYCHISTPTCGILYLQAVTMNICLVSCQNVWLWNRGEKNIWWLLTGTCGHCQNATNYDVCITLSVVVIGRLPWEYRQHWSAMEMKRAFAKVASQMGYAELRTQPGWGYLAHEWIWITVIHVMMQ